MTLDEIIRDAIVNTLRNNNYNKVATAKELDVSRRTIYKYLPDDLKDKSKLKREYILDGNSFKRRYWEVS